MGKRSGRLKQFNRGNTGGWSSASPSLVASARLLLSAALQDRAQQFSNLRTHSTTHAPGAIALIVVAFEVWLNELLLDLLLPPAETRKLLNQDTATKYSYLFGVFKPSQPPRFSNDLTVALDVRNEIVHHFPRPADTPDSKPAWYPNLQRCGLFVTTGNPSEDFNLSQKLTSYSLAYWVFEVIDHAVADLVEGSLNPKARIQVGSTAENFKRYRSLEGPDGLTRFDAQHGISVTRAI